VRARDQLRPPRLGALGPGRRGADARAAHGRRARRRGCGRLAVGRPRRRVPGGRDEHPVRRDVPRPRADAGLQGRPGATQSGRWLAANMPNARLVELPGDDHVPWYEGRDEWLAEVQEFLTGTRPPARIERVLATVLFTDIVESTSMASQLGDQRWRELLEGHQ